MYKVLSVVLLIFTAHTSYASGQLQQLSPTHELVKAKLWYEGLTSEDLKSTGYAKKEGLKPMPEELSVALEKLDS